MATGANDAAVVFPHISPVGPLAPTPTVSKLVKVGATFSEARWPGGAPVDIFGAVAAPMDSWTRTFHRSSFPGLPDRSILIVSRPGPATRFLFVYVPVIDVSGLRMLSIMVGSTVYHQSTSELPFAPPSP